MLLIMVTVVESGVVSHVEALHAYSPIIDEFERVCKKYTGEGFKRARVTLWDTETAMSHGTRYINVSKLVEPTTAEIREWIKSNCATLIEADKKIQAIKETRTKFYSEDPTGYRMGLREAKDHVEAVIKEYKAERLQSKTSSYCGSGHCTYTYCDCY